MVVGLAASPAASAPIGHAAPPAAGAKGRPRQSKARRGLGRFPTSKWTEVTMQVTKLLDAQSCDLRRVRSDGSRRATGIRAAGAGSRQPTAGSATTAAHRFRTMASSPSESSSATSPSCANVGGRVATAVPTAVPTPHHRANEIFHRTGLSTVILIIESARGIIARSPNCDLRVVPFDSIVLFVRLLIKRPARSSS